MQTPSSTLKPNIPSTTNPPATSSKSSNLAEKMKQFNPLQKKADPPANQLNKPSAPQNPMGMAVPQQ